MENVPEEIIIKHEEFVKKVMEHILDCDDDIFKILKKQYSNSKMTTQHTFTGHGFFTSFQVPDELSFRNMNGIIDDVFADIKDTDKVDLFMLWIENGKIKCLEGVASYGDWEYNYDEKVLRNAFYNATTRRYNIKFAD